MNATAIFNGGRRVIATATINALIKKGVLTADEAIDALKQRQLVLLSLDANGATWYPKPPRSSPELSIAINKNRV